MKLDKSSVGAVVGIVILLLLSGALAIMIWVMGAIAGYHAAQDDDGRVHLWMPGTYVMEPGDIVCTPSGLCSNTFVQ
jgi:hypothetical protein